MANRCDNNGNSERLYFLGLQNHCRWWLQPWNKRRLLLGRKVMTQPAAKSLQSCPTLCESIDGSPPGSPVPGILQARTLEWVAISFSNAWKWKWSRSGSSVLGIFQARVLEWVAIAFSMTNLDGILKGRDIADKGPSCQSYGFSSSHVWMWELDYRESWMLKNWCFWTVEKTLESPLDCKEIQPVHLKGN